MNSGLKLNRELISVEPFSEINGYSIIYVKAAQNRFMRFLPYIASAFPETAEKKGVIESVLVPLSPNDTSGQAEASPMSSVSINPIQDAWKQEGLALRGKVFLKDETKLPISGSVKDRGVIHGIMRLAETLMQREKMLLPNENYARIDSDEFREFFGRYTIPAEEQGSGKTTECIRRFAGRLGFQTELPGEPSGQQAAPADMGGEQQAKPAGAASAENVHELNYRESEDVFFGYATAAVRLAIQLMKQGAAVDEEHPLFVYLPGISGMAAGGICYGLKQKFGDCAHCFYAELPDAADGAKSQFAEEHAGNLVSGRVTVSEDALPGYQHLLKEAADCRVSAEGSAAMALLKEFARPSVMEAYLASRGLSHIGPEQVTQVVWAAG